MVDNVSIDQGDQRLPGSIWQIIRASLSDAADDLFTTAVVHLLWLILTLLLVTAPPATVALFYVANRKAHGEVTDVGDFFFALRRLFRLAWRWGVVNAFVIFFLAGDFILTGRLIESPTAQLVQGFYLTLLFTWLFLQLYALPLMFEQKEPSLRQAWRNAAVMLGKNIGFSVMLAVSLAVVLLLSAVFFLIIMAAGALLVALIANHAVLNRLAVKRNSA